jgi:hypothetical protein
MMLDNSLRVPTTGLDLSMQLFSTTATRLLQPIKNVYVSEGEIILFPLLLLATTTSRPWQLTVTHSHNNIPKYCLHTI